MDGLRGKPGSSEKGQQGDDGEAGAVGPVGPTGSPGPMGKQGPKGYRGEDIVSKEKNWRSVAVQSKHPSDSILATSFLIRSYQKTNNIFFVFEGWA